jgi:hypothetical protein
MNEGSMMQILQRGRLMDQTISTKDYAVLKGVVRGNTIELEQAPGLPDGLEIIVAIRLKPGDGIRLSAGAWGDMTPEELAELERILSMARGRPVKLS